MKRRILLAILVVLLVAGALAWIFGPRLTVDPSVSFDPATIGGDPQAYVEAQEAAVDGLTEETAKEIVWAYPASRARTPLSVVYVHGYSGDKRELRPVPDEVAERLGANLFLTRLSGHGLDFAALAEPSANDWLNDFVEALAIGRRLGERVIVISTSTGGTLSAWAASEGLTDDVAGFVMVSPNFRLQDWRARLVGLPFAEGVLPLFVGDGVELTLAEPDANGNETAVFPSRALLPMAALVEAVRGIDVSAIRTPALFVYSPRDEVVDPTATEEVIRDWGGPSEVLLVENAEDRLQHMLAGDFFSPSTTEPVVEAIVRWVEDLPDAP